MDKRSSAPELPHEVAARYGLHSDGSQPAGVPQPVGQVDVPLGLSIDNNPETDNEVDNIVAAEGDQLLNLQVRGLLRPGDIPAGRSHGFWRRLGHVFVLWWQNKWARYITIAIVIGGIGTVLAVPRSRYVVLNSVGVRSSASVTVLDQSTQLPLKNVTVNLAGRTLLTDRNGMALFTGLRLGGATLQIRRIAFASYERHIVVGWGSNPIGPIALRVTGVQYAIVVADYVSGNPITGAEADTAAATALADKLGRVTLTVEDTSDTKLSVTVSADGYITKPVTLDASNHSSFRVALVPNGKDVFVSDQGGRYGVYTADLDGQNRTLVLAGTGNERADMSLVVKSDGTRAALVSTRDNRRDGDGYLLRTLTVINLENGTSVSVDHAEQIQVIDWVGNMLVYNTTIAGASGANPQRNRLVAYDFDANSRVQLANANQFNAIISARGNVYYTVSSTDPNATLGLFKVRLDGTHRQRLSNSEIWTGLHTAYGTLSLQSPDGWYEYDLTKGTFSKVSTPPVLTSYAFANSPTGQQSIWSDAQAGKDRLLIMNITKDTSTVLQEQEGITDPFRWVDKEHIVYRVSNKQETADYVVGAGGGAAHKIADVTATYGFARSY